jgi:hypothetical protein
MNHLYEYLNPKETVIVSKYSLKAAPLQLKGKIYDVIENLVDGEAKDILIKNIGDWYKDNSKRRNIKGSSMVDVSFFGGDKSDKLVTDVIAEVDRIGALSASGEFESFDRNHIWVRGLRCGGAIINFSAATYKQFEEGNYKYDKSFTDCSLTFSKTNYGNGYNDLPAADINAICQKVYDCMIDTECEIVSTPGYHASGAPDIPRFRVILTAVYDKKKLKNLLAELKGDRRLQNFADRMDAANKGIAAYYASKRSGEYTGD